MKTVVFVQGGGRGTYAEDEGLAADLRERLGAAYDVRYPAMPREENPEYEEWKDRITEELAGLDEVILVGHSLGGSILLKILSEGSLTSSVAGLHLVAPPYWGVEDWRVDEYELRDDFAANLPEGVPLFLYHSRDDEVVPFEHLALYAEKLPRATVRRVDGRGHQFDDDLSEVARDVEGISGGQGRSGRPR